MSIFFNDGLLNLGNIKTSGSNLHQTALLRSYAVSLGALAMGLVGLRGAILGEFAPSVAKEAIIALVVFMGIGAVAGWIADYLVRDSLERTFRARVEWYRKGLVEAGCVKPNSSRDS